MNKIAVIPARSGSKGLKDKNIIALCGKPMIAYSIEAALKSGLFERVIVTTDSLQYGKIADGEGAEVVYRGEDASSDTASTFAVLADLFKRIGTSFDYFALLQPTSPMRTSEHIKEAVKLFESRFSEFDFLVSVKAAEYNGLLVRPIEEDLSLKYFDTDFANYRRQNYNDYSPNGAIFLGKPKKYLEKRHFFGGRSIAYKMSAIDSLDVDTELDYKFAALCLEERLKELYKNEKGSVCDRLKS